jgi:tetratricopeptide (TPR) repeat protein
MIREQRFAEAASLCDALCRNNGNDAEAWFLHGAVRAQLGDLERAIECCRRALEIRPGYVEARYNLAQALMHKERWEEAAECLLHVLRHRPGHADACNNLGYALQRLGRHAEAVTYHERALEIDPGKTEAAVSLGTALLGLGRRDEAERAFNAALRMRPDYAEAHYNLGLVFLARGDLPNAIGCFRQAIRHKPNYADAYNNLAGALTEYGDHRGAEECLRHALLFQPESVPIRLNHGNTLISLGRLDEALQTYLDARDQDPGNLDAIAGQADIHEKKREYEKAHELLRPHIEARTTHIGILACFARLCRRIERCDQAIDLIEAALRTDLADANRQQLHFHAGDLLDRAKDYEKAFKHYHRGNTSKSVTFDPSQHEREIDRLIESYSAGFMAQAPRAGQVGDRPVFIVGMPRSGTSLVEQILASHPDVHGAGELAEIPNLVTELPRRLGSVRPYPECLVDLGQDHVDRWSAEYLQRLAALSAGSVRVTDKMPHNFMHLGLIELLFPGARVIHCRRDPIDTCLSCYFHDFGGYHPYAYNLSHLGDYYRHYRRLMEHWKSVLRLPLLEVQYETLIDDQERVSRELVAFCGLNWDPRCLEFHRASRFANTASYDQVQRPLYRDSVTRWKNYAPFIGPLVAALND